MTLCVCFVYRQNYTELMIEAKQAGEQGGLKYVGSTCLRALYYAILITRGYEFDSGTKQIKVIDKVKDQPLGLHANINSVLRIYY